MKVQDLIRVLQARVEYNPDYAEAEIIFDGTTPILGGIFTSKDGQPVLLLAPIKLDQMEGGF